MSVLTKEELERRIKATEEDKSLVITPLLDDEQIGPASIDVRLGNEFILFRPANIEVINPSQEGEFSSRIETFQERLSLRFGEAFILHPDQFVLGCTLEYVALPCDVNAYVIGRSSWGRLGLTIATATAVAPGYKGIITLELANVGLTPLKLFPGMIIAQLVFELCDQQTAPHQGRYNVSVEPQFSRIEMDRNLEFWANPQKFR